VAGAPFTSNDPRINRAGRPRTGETFTDILRRKLQEPNDDPDGPDKRTFHIDGGY
jgi:hypothetical protein